MHQLARILSVALLTLPLLGGTADEKYPIRLNRETWKPGDKESFELVYAAVVTTHTVWDGITPVDTETSTGVHLECSCEILEATDGVPLAAAYTVRHYTRLKDKEDVEVLAPGKKFIARLDGDQTKFTIDDAPAPDEVKDELSRLIQFVRPEKWVGEDDQLGASEPKAIGDAWPVNVSTIALGMRRSGMEVQDKDITGTATLLAVETGDTGPCLRVRAKVEARKFSRSSIAPPSDTHLRSSSASTTREWLVPVDAARPVSQSSRTTTWRYVSDGRVQGRDYTSEQNVTEQTVIRRLSAL